MQLTVKEQVWMNPDTKPVFHPTNGAEAESAALLLTLSFYPNVACSGFRPAHLQR